MYTLVCEFYSGDMDARQIICLPVSESWGTPHQYHKFMMTSLESNILDELPHLEKLWPENVFDLSSWDDNRPIRKARLSEIYGWYDDEGYHPFVQENFMEFESF